MEKIEILPDDLYKFRAPAGMVKKVKKAIKSLDWVPNVHNQTSEEKFLFTLPAFSPLRDWVSQCLDEVRMDLMLDCERLELSLMWANRTETNQWHHSHNHSFSYASGILFLTETDSRTWFSKERYWQRDGLFTICGENENTHVIHKYSPNPGDLVIFPSSLQHSVDEHTLDSPRYTVSFNAVPAGAMGRLDSAAFVNYQVVTTV